MGEICATFSFCYVSQTVDNFYNICLSVKLAFYHFFVIFQFFCTRYRSEFLPFPRVKESVRNIQFMSSSDEFLFRGFKFRLVESLLLSGV